MSNFDMRRDLQTGMQEIRWTQSPPRSVSSAPLLLLCLIISPRAHLHVVECCGLCSRARPLLSISVLVAISVFMALSTVFHSINPPDISLLSHSILPVLFLPYWSFQQSLYESLPTSDIVRSG